MTSILAFPRPKHLLKCNLTVARDDKVENFARFIKTDSPYKIFLVKVACACFNVQYLYYIDFFYPSVSLKTFVFFIRARVSPKQWN